MIPKTAKNYKLMSYKVEINNYICYKNINKAQDLQKILLHSSFVAPTSNVVVQISNYANIIRLSFDPVIITEFCIRGLKTEI